MTRERVFTRPFLLAALANLLHGLAVFAFLHLPGFVEELGATPTVVGIVFGTLSGAAMVVRPFAGRVMDSAGRRVVILVAGVVHVVACLLYLTVTDIGPWIYVVRCIHGFAQGSLFSVLFTYAADIVPPSRRSEGIGYFGVSGMLPMALGGLMGDIVLAHGSYQTLFVVNAVVASLALIVSFWLPEPPRDADHAPRGFFSALTQRDLLPIWAVGIFFATALAGVFTFIKNFVELEGIGTVGLFFSSYSATTITLRITLGWLPDRAGLLRVLYPSLLLFTVALIALSLAAGVPGLMLGGFLAGCGHGFAFPILSTMVVERANPSDRGSAVSLFTAVFDVGIFLGGPFLGWIAGPTEDYRLMFLVASALPLVGLATFHFWNQWAHPPKPADSSAE